MADGNGNGGRRTGVLTRQQTPQRNGQTPQRNGQAAGLMNGVKDPSRWKTRGERSTDAQWSRYQTLVDDVRLTGLVEFQTREQFDADGNGKANISAAITEMHQLLGLPETAS